MVHAKCRSEFGSIRVSPHDPRCRTWQDLLPKGHRSYEKLESDQLLLICFVEDLFVVSKRKDVLLDTQLVIA
jgi:hypothetical protein